MTAATFVATATSWGARTTATATATSTSVTKGRSTRNRRHRSSGDGGGGFITLSTGKRRKYNQEALESGEREPLADIDMVKAQPRGRAVGDVVDGDAHVSLNKKGGGVGRRIDADYSESDTVATAVNGHTAKRGASKRKAVEYEEDVEGFQFSRAGRSKKPRPPSPPTPLTVAEGLEEEEDGDLLLPRQRSTRQNHTAKSDATMHGSSAQMTNGTGLENRSKRMRSKQPAEEDPSSQPAPGRPQRGRRKKLDTNPSQAKPPRTTKETRVELVEGEKSPQTTGTKIALPLADTPIIRRNKKMRRENAAEGQRRSSFGMRGRRASSLIESGASNALPHHEVDTADFYKHIENELPELRRMRQLLTWCATRALGEKPSGSKSEDESARLAARVIQEELLEEFSNRSELSDWFSRDETTPPAVAVKKPNPKNIQNADKIKELEEQIQRLQAERQSLSALLRPPIIPQMKPQLVDEQSEERHRSQIQQSTSDRTTSTSLTDSVQTSNETENSQSIDISLLDPSQKYILAFLNNASESAAFMPSTLSSSKLPAKHTSPLSITEINLRLSRLTVSLAPNIDSFAAGIHEIELFRHTADTLASHILTRCARLLEARDSALGKSVVGQDGVLPIAEDDGGGGGKERRKDENIMEEEDLGVVLGALSRVERR